MGQRELLLTVGAIALFGLASLRINQAAVGHADAIYGQQAELYALSLAQQLVEEAKTKQFDERAINQIVDDIPGDFTGSPGLGPDPDEVYPNFDDLDDFNGLTRTVDTDVGPMEVNVQAYYVDESDLETAVSPKKPYKRMTVTVTSAYLNSPVQVHYIFAWQRIL